MISVLCVNKDSIYKSIPGVDAWDLERDAYKFNGTNPVITHAPCQQWSRLKHFANDNPKEKELAWFCLEKVNANGGVFEHPAGSSFFKDAGIKKIYSVDQFWFGFPARKRTYLYFSKCKPLPVSLRFDAIELTVGELRQERRSDTTIEFATWLINSINR